MEPFSAELGNRNLKEDLESLQKQIKAKPRDADLRLFLFQLLSVLGQWELASVHIKICGQLSKRAARIASFYDSVIRGEVARQAVFKGRQTANLMALRNRHSPPLDWVGLLTKTLQNPSDDVIESREKVLEAATPCAGTITLRSFQYKRENDREESFSWIRDGDSRLGPICEIITNGKYYWVPFNHIRKINIFTPEGLCDAVWANASVTLIDGHEQICMIPARYPAYGEYASQDDASLLGRATFWETRGDAPHRIGIGQKTLFSDVGEYTILNINTIVFDHEATNDMSGSTSSPA